MRRLSIDHLIKMNLERKRPIVRYQVPKTEKKMISISMKKETFFMWIFDFSYCKTNGIKDFLCSRSFFELNFFNFIIFITNLSTNIINRRIIVWIGVFNQLHVTIFESKNETKSKLMSKFFVLTNFRFFLQQIATSALKPMAMRTKTTRRI